MRVFPLTSSDEKRCSLCGIDCAVDPTDQTWSTARTTINRTYDTRVTSKGFGDPGAGRRRRRCAMCLRTVLLLLLLQVAGNNVVSTGCEHAINLRASAQTVVAATVHVHYYTRGYANFGRNHCFLVNLPTIHFTCVLHSYRVFTRLQSTRL